LKVLSRHAAGLLPLFAEIVQMPSFPRERLEPVRSQMLVALKEEEDDAAEVARKLFYEVVFGSHPAHRPVEGTEATVRTLSRESLVRFHSRYYRPDNVTLVAVGDFRATQLLEQLTAAFRGWQVPGVLTRDPLPPIARQTDRRARYVTREKAQTQIVLGHLGINRGNPDYVALRVMDTILGEGVSGGFTARIPYQLRDVQGLAYSVGSSISSSAAREPGVFIAALGTEPKQAQRAVAALVKEIVRIRATPVTETELNEAVNYLASSYVFRFQTNDQLADYLQETSYYGLGANYRQRFVQDVRRVTRADVLRVARKYLDPDHYTLVVVGPDVPRAR
jgi:zinc protease